MHIRGSEESKGSINITPMLDVVFIMLIFFIVTATFTKEVGLDFNQSEREPTTFDPEKKSIVIKIDDRDRIHIANRAVDMRSVRANVERLHVENPNVPMVISPHDDSSNGVVVHVWDDVHEAGISKVSFSAQ